MLVYGLLAVNWPGLAPAYVRCVSAVGNQFFGTMTADGRVTFEAHPHQRWTSVQTLFVRGNPIGARRDHDSRQDYLATAFLVALVLSTPIPRRRRFIAAAAGLVLVHIFLGFRVWLGLLDAFSDKQLSLIEFPAFVKNSLGLVVTILVGSIEASFIAPLFIWALVTFRRGDGQLLGLISPGPIQSADHSAFARISPRRSASKKENEPSTGLPRYG